MSAEIKDVIREIVVPPVASRGLELVDIELRREGRGLVLRIIIYRDGGVTIDDCAEVSREVGYLLEVNDPLDRAYTLEVSSPGLDRPLKTARDFERNLGNKVDIIYRNEDANTNLTGVISQVVDGERLLIKTTKREVEIPLHEIVKAKQVIEF